MTSEGEAPEEIRLAPLRLKARPSAHPAPAPLVPRKATIEGWHWIRDTQLHEEAHCHRGNGAGVLATLRTALTLLRLGVQSIRAGMQALCTT
jgi:hypothetical protein